MAHKVCPHPFLGHVTIHPLCSALPTWRKAANVGFFLVVGTTYTYQFYRNWHASEVKSLPFKILFVAIRAFGGTVHAGYSLFRGKNSPTPAEQFKEAIDTFNKDLDNGPFQGWNQTDSFKKFFAVFKTAFNRLNTFPAAIKKETVQRFADNIVELYIAARFGKIINLDSNKCWIFSDNPNITEDYFDQFYKNGTAYNNMRILYNSLGDVLSKSEDPVIAQLIKRYPQDLSKTHYNPLLKEVEEDRSETIETCIQTINKEVAVIWAHNPIERYYKIEGKISYIPTDGQTTIDDLGRRCSKVRTEFGETLLKKTNSSKDLLIWDSVEQQAFELHYYHFKLASLAIKDFVKIAKTHKWLEAHFIKNLRQTYASTVLGQFVAQYHAFRQAADVQSTENGVIYITPNNTLQQHAKKFYTKGTFHYKARLQFNQIHDELAKIPGTAELLKTPKLKKDESQETYSNPKLGSSAPTNPSSQLGGAQKDPPITIEECIENICKETMAMVLQGPIEAYYKATVKICYLPTEDKIHALGHRCYKEKNTFEHFLCDEAKELAPTENNLLWDSVTQKAFENHYYHYVLVSWALSDFLNMTEAHKWSEQGFVDNLTQTYVFGVLMQFMNQYHAFRQAAHVKKNDKGVVIYTTPESTPPEYAEKFYTEGTFHHRARIQFNDIHTLLAKIPGTAKLLENVKFKKDESQETYANPKLGPPASTVTNTS